MLSEDILTVVRRLEWAAQTDEPVDPPVAERLAGVLRVAAEDAGALESMPLALGHGPVVPAVDVGLPVD